MTNKSRNLKNVVITYSMGVFNDNFFKQAVLLLAASAALLTIQGAATAMLALPFILFSAWGGWFADHFPKKNIILVAKTTELATMLLAITAMYMNHWYMMVTVIFLMGLQSTFFSPALNGSIPEYFERSEVPRVNAIIKLVTTVFMLLGIASAGFILDIPAPGALVEHLPVVGEKPFGRIMIGVSAFIVAAIGLLTAMRIIRIPASNTTRRPFPWLGPIDSLRQAKEYYLKDPELLLVMVSESYFYFISGGYALLCINNLGIQQLGFSFSTTSLMSVALMIGIGIGSLKAGKNDASSWQRNFIPAGVVISLGLIFSSAVFLLPESLRLAYLIVLYIITGTAGGAYLIPLMSYIQIRPNPGEKSKVLGISNFFAFSGIMLGGLLFSVIPGHNPFFSPSNMLIYGGVFTIILLMWARKILPRIKTIPLQAQVPSVIGTIVYLLLNLRYSFTITGLDRIRALQKGESYILLPNHPSLTDPITVSAIMLGTKPRPLADVNQMSSIFGRLAAKITKAIILPDASLTGRKDVEKIHAALAAVSHALNCGENVLFYPAGRMLRGDKTDISGNSGLHRVLKGAPEARIILARIKGMWGSSFSYGYDGKAPVFGSVLLKNLGRLALNLFIFMPKRNVSIEFYEPDDFPRDAGKIQLNEYLEKYYNEFAHEPVRVRYYFWQAPLDLHKDT